MHASVWVITSRTRKDMEAAVSSGEDAGFAAELMREAESITAGFNESNHQERDDTRPPIRYDGQTVGGRWAGNINPGTGRDFNTCKEASELPTENLPRIVVSPKGYPASAPATEEKPEIRRVLRPWPNNVALALDWHY